MTLLGCYVVWSKVSSLSSSFGRLACAWAIGKGIGVSLRSLPDDYEGALLLCSMTSGHCPCWAGLKLETDEREYQMLDLSR